MRRHGAWDLGRFAARPLVFFALIGCSSDTSGTLPADFTLAIGDHAQITDSPWSVAVDSLVSDSRCPVDVVCVQAGEAVFALELTNPAADTRPPDNPHFLLGSTPVTSEGFRFTLAEVTPARHSGQTIPPAAYRVTLHIERN